MPSKDVISMEVSRSEGKTVFKFKVPSRITEFYKNVSKEVRDSGNWEGLRFYYVPQITDSRSYKDNLQNVNLFDDYGSGLYKEGRLNIAWLRTVGSDGKITVSDSISFAEMSILIQNATRFIKRFFEEHLADFKVGGSITLEV